MTLTGARALVVRGGDGGRDSTGSDGVALLAIPRSPLLRARHDLDENACNRWCWRLLRQRLQPLDTETSLDTVDVVAADDDAAAVAEIVAFYYFLAGSTVDP